MSASNFGNGSYSDPVCYRFQGKTFAVLLGIWGSIALSDQYLILRPGLRAFEDHYQIFEGLWRKSFCEGSNGVGVSLWHNVESSYMRIFKSCCYLLVAFVERRQWIVNERPELKHQISCISDRNCWDQSTLHYLRLVEGRRHFRSL